MSSLAKRCVLFVVLVVAAFTATTTLGVEVGRAEEPAEEVSESTQATLEKVAATLGFSSWTEAGFWDAYQAAVVKQQETLELERIAKAQQIINDVHTFGRRAEDTTLIPLGETKYVPFLEIVPAPSGDIFDALIRSGVDTIDLSTGEIERRADYWDPYDKLSKVAQVWSVIKDGVETITRVDERVPGSIDLKVGDTRPAPAPTKSAAGKKPNTFDPKKDGSLGRASGGQQPDQWKSDETDDSGRAKPDSASGASEGAQASGSSAGTSGGQTTTSSSGDSHPQYVFLGEGPKRQNDDGSTSQNTLHQRTEDGVYVQTVTTTQKDGSQTKEQHCFKDSQEVDCGSGMTDEPTCRIDCVRLSMLLQILFCTSGGGGGSECGLPPEGIRPNPWASADEPCPEGGESDASTTHVGPPQPPRDGDFQPDCTSADAPGGPSDYGDPTDPNGEEPPDITWLLLLLNDGVTDPVEPGAEEETLEESARLDMYGTLRDPVGPPGSEEEDTIPGGGPPSTGEAEREP